MRLLLVAFASALLALATAGCVTTTPAHDLSVESVRALRVERVAVTVDPGARITWPTLAQQLIDARKARTGVEDGDSSAAIAEMKSAVLARLNEKARTVLEPSLKSTLSGTKPVTARVTVHSLFIPNTAGVMVSTLFAGPTAPGAQSGMGVSVDFVDARTGAPVLSYPKTGVITQGGYKINMGTSGLISHDPVERMFADLDGRLRSWLLKS
ncbi:MAG TPA: hypothetical protein VKB34_15835 [Povalibacter sp.]|nr:hypothetical protein [Povalibacter sp.]